MLHAMGCFTRRTSINTYYNTIEIAKGFEQKENFLRCIGAVDKKHIRTKKLENSEYLYFNYRDYYSIVFLVIVDSEYRFLCVDIGSYEKTATFTF